MGVFMSPKLQQKTSQKISYKAMVGSQKLDTFFAVKPKSADGNDAVGEQRADEQKEAGDKEE